MKHANALLLSWKLCPKSLFYFFFIFLFLFFLIFFCCNGFWKLLLRPKCLLTRDCTRVLRCYPGMTPCWSSLKFVSQVSWLLLLFVVGILHFLHVPGCWMIINWKDKCQSRFTLLVSMVEQLSMSTFFCCVLFPLHSISHWLQILFSH